jgi:hypothetical protein
MYFKLFPDFSRLSCQKIAKVVGERLAPPVHIFTPFLRILTF